MNEVDEAPRCGHVAIVGRPNVGKSTLMNRVLGQKLSITSRRPQTTRHNVLGICTEGAVQIVFTDTPGVPGRPTSLMDAHFGQAVSAALLGVDAVLMVAGGTRWGEADERIMRTLPDDCPRVLALNKVDVLADKGILLPHLQRLSGLGFAAMMPISARRGEGVPRLLEELRALLPSAEHQYDAEQLTDRPERFFAAEMVREQLMRQLGQELPYRVEAELERMVEESDGRRIIDIAILVDRPSHKGMVIGRGGQRLRQLGQRAREAMEELFGAPVVLRLWVKMSPGWTDNPQVLAQLGFGAER